jgi:3,4-dihydroxy 2-butanone 4-phosphate synthase/GTP cyclohydrolase II
LQRIISEGVGAVIYLHQNSLGFSHGKIDGADSLEFHKDERGQVSPEGQRSTQREIGIGAQILHDLNLRRIRLMTNHPRPVAALESYGIEIVEHIPLPTVKTPVLDSPGEETAVEWKLVTAGV